MKERPIIFSAEMVLAILDGRKTMDRRPVECPPYDAPDDGIDVAYATGHIQCPYGQVGDKLWVKESWAAIWTEYEPDEGQSIWDVPHKIEYRADTNAKYPGHWPDDMGDDPDCPRWKSPAVMPRHASRILLEITDIRVERVQEISLDNIEKEGVLYDDHNGRGHLKAKFESLWDSINAKRGPKIKESDLVFFDEEQRQEFIDGKHSAYAWAMNPWAWAITFKRLQP